MAAIPIFQKLLLGKDLWTGPNAENGDSAGQIRIVIEITPGCETPD